MILGLAFWKYHKCMQITDKSGHAYIYWKSLFTFIHVTWLPDHISLFCKDCYLHNCLIVNIVNFQSHGIIDFFVRANIKYTKNSKICQFWSRVKTKYRDVCPPYSIYYKLYVKNILGDTQFILILVSWILLF